MKEILSMEKLLSLRDKLDIKVLFILVFIILNLYYLVIKEELYESKTVLMVRDLSSSAPSANLGLDILGVGSSSQLQDSMVVQEYLLSLDMFLLLDTEFSIIGHYKSSELDFFERLSPGAKIEKSFCEEN